MRLFSQDSKVQALGRAPLFEGLSKKDLTELARLTEDMEIAAGKTLCKEDTLGYEFFVIVEGEVEIRKKGRKVATRGPGEFFGEMALIERIPRTATVKATTPLRFFVLTRQSFNRLLDQQPSVERKVLRALARRVLQDIA